MNNRIAPLAVAIGAVVVAVAACSGASTAGAPEPIAPTTSLPPRPQDIDLAGVDTCTLLTPEQQRQLGTDTRPEFTNYPDRYGNRRCYYGKNLSSPRFGYQIKVVTQEDVTVYLTGQRDVTAQVVSIAEFPAVQYLSPGDETGCFVGVSTKDGQYLNVQYGESSGSGDTTEVACEKARVAAEMATQTLLTQR